LFDLHRQIRFTFHPQATCSFAGDSNAGMFRTLSGGRIAQTVDCLDNSGGVKDLGSIRDNIRSALYGGFNIYTPFRQSV
jgi:hypothetical protein